MKSCNSKNNSFLNIKFNPITAIIKSLLITIMMTLIAACQGGSGSSNSSTNTAATSNSSINLGVLTFLCKFFPPLKFYLQILSKNMPLLDSNFELAWSTFW